jgi:hypothetical protein
MRATDGYEGANARIWPCLHPGISQFLGSAHYFLKEDHYHTGYWSPRADTPAQSKAKDRKGMMMVPCELQASMRVLTPVFGPVCTQAFLIFWVQLTTS